MPPMLENVLKIPLNMFLIAMILGIVIGIISWQIGLTEKYIKTRFFYFVAVGSAGLSIAMSLAMFGVSTYICLGVSLVFAYLFIVFGPEHL